MLYLIGLGLSDEKDVTVRGLEAIKGSDRIYLEAYTSILGVGKERLVCLWYSSSLLRVSRGTESSATARRRLAKTTGHSSLALHADLTW